MSSESESEREDSESVEGTTSDDDDNIDAFDMKKKSRGQEVQLKDHQIVFKDVKELNGHTAMLIKCFYKISVRPEIFLKISYLKSSLSCVVYQKLIVL